MNLKMICGKCGNECSLYEGYDTDYVVKTECCKHDRWRFSLG